MPIEGSYLKINGILKGAGIDSTERYNRTALGNAVRYSTLLGVLDKDRILREQAKDKSATIPEGSSFITNREELVNALDSELERLGVDYSSAINSEDNNSFLSTQQALQSREYSSELGQTVDREIAFNAAREFSSRGNPISFGTSNTAKRFFSSFTRGDSDYFGSKTLYKNVFEPYANGFGINGEALSERDRIINNVDDDYGITASQKVLRGIVKASMYSASDAINRIDVEFNRFIGESMVDTASLTGSGLQAARQIVNRTLERGTAFQQQIDNTYATAKTLIESTDSGERLNAEGIELQGALQEIRLGYSNRGRSEPEFINKSGVASFIDLFNSAEDKITIETYQFQNDTTSAALADLVKRRVLEKALGNINGKETKPFVVNMMLAYPKNRDSSIISSQEKGNIGDTGFSILGPNLIEAMKMKELELELKKYLVEEVGIAAGNVDNYLQINVGFRDRKFHPKLYMSDTMAAIGTQNLTGPVGNSINQAGSNFEQMFVARDKFRDDDQLYQAKSATGNYALKRGESQQVFTQSDIRTSLLFKQIQQLSAEEERYSASGKEGYGLLNKRGQVGLSGDIYQHLRNTINFTSDYYGIGDSSTKAPGMEKKAGGKGEMSMYFILDGAFMLQYGLSSFDSKQGRGEMGDDWSPNLYKKEDQRRTNYTRMQGKLFDLMILGQANVTVDVKNYKEQIYDPLAQKIMAMSDDSKLKQNFIRSGQNLGLMAGNSIFGPKTSDGLSQSKKAMIAYLRTQGFDKENFTKEDLIQIIGMGSGAIHLSSAPRQHAKSYGLMQNQFDSSGRVKSRNLVSYYMGSSNLGLYSLGIPNNKDNKTYTEEDFKSVNTEMGLMLGSTLTVNGAQIADFSRNRLGVDQQFETLDQRPVGNEDLNNWALSQQQERDELGMMQERFILTHEQLGNNRLSHPDHLNIKHTPLWMDNVNQGGLQVLQKRLIEMRDNLGLDETAFKIQERLSEDKSIKSFNITINMATVLGEKGFMSASANLPKLNFELSVLNGPARGMDMYDERTPDAQLGEIPGYVYFVDKNKTVGNGLFVNNTYSNIEVMGRSNYDDKFDYKGSGRVNVGIGQSAHMSSLDIVPQMFATMMSEGILRLGVNAPISAYSSLDENQRNTVIDEYIAKSIWGEGTHIEGTKEYKVKDLSISVARDISATELLERNLNYISSEEFVGKISVELFGDSVSNKILEIIRAKTPAKDPDGALAQSARVFSEMSQEFERLSHGGDKVAQLDNIRRSIKSLLHYNQHLIPEVMKYGSNNINQYKQELNAYKQYTATLFDPFLSGSEERTYGGQQGFYKTILMGLTGTSFADKQTAALMRELDPEAKDIAQMYAYSRMQALAYNPTTDLHEFMYRSIASKSTSMPSNISNADSLLFEQEARQMGDAANLRLMESIGVGTILKSNYYLESDGNLSTSLKEITNASIQDTAAGSLSALRDRVAANMAEAFRAKFGGSMEEDNFIVKNQELLQFYTGNKIAQLPQRIKNAMGARPMYQYSVEAQRILESHPEQGQSVYKTIYDLTSNYNQKYRTQVEQARQLRLKSILNSYGVNTNGGITNAMASINPSDSKYQTMGEEMAKVQRLTENMFDNSTYGLGAVFGGNIKTILSQDQLNFVRRKRSQLEELFEGMQDSAGLVNEALRVEVLRASLSLGGLGKMIAGSERTKYDMAFIQLNGTYTDTFLANPLYGNVYKSSETYLELRGRGKPISDADIENGNVLNRGSRQGYLETQQRSIKSSMIGEMGVDKGVGRAGMEKIVQRGDRVVEVGQNGTVFDGKKGTGKFAVQRQNKSGEWEYVKDSAGNIVLLDEKRNVRSIGNIIDNTGFSTVGTPALGAVATSNFGRAGEKSIDMIYDSEFRAGNFAGNEYLQSMHRLRSVMPGGGRRVEGTDSSTLIKGVANFAGEVEFDGNRAEDELSASYHGKTMNLFQSLEIQMQSNINQWNRENIRGGTMQIISSAVNGNSVYQDVGAYKSNNQTGFTPISSMVHGLYNSNNFKSFFWSHGAKILTATEVNSQTGVADHFLLKGLFNSETENNVNFAKKMMGGLILAFGDEFITIDNAIDANKLDRKSGTPQVIKEIQHSLIRAMEEGTYGSSFRAIAVASRQLALIEHRQNSGEDLNAYNHRINDFIFKQVKQKSVFNELALGGLSGITAQEVLTLMTSTDDRIVKETANTLVSRVRALAEAGKSEQGYVSLGGVEGFGTRQAAAIVSAVDLFQQMTAQSNGFKISSDINISDHKVREILLGVTGVGPHANKNEQDALLEMLQGASSSINMVSVFVENAFSISKDPTGTQSVARHEGQHLIQPFLGDIKAFQKGGQLDRIQHTVASLMALVSGSKSGMIYYDSLDAKSFGRGRAINLRGEAASYLVSPWHQKDFLGFYQTQDMSAYTQPFIGEYKKIAAQISSGEWKNNFDSVDSHNEKGQLIKAYDINSDIRDFLKTKYYAGMNISDRDLESKVKEIRQKGSTWYAMMRFENIESHLKLANDSVESNPLRQVGNTADFLNNMNNKQLFFSIPMITFSEESGQVITRVTNQDIYSFLPSARMMRDLGAQHQDFIDPVMDAYKAISSLFTPGHIASTALSKVMAGMDSNSSIMLTQGEAKALSHAMEAVERMPIEIESALASQQVQNAMGGKHKYQGFTATGIGSLLVPSGNVVLPTSKMQEAGLVMGVDSERLTLARAYAEKSSTPAVVKKVVYRTLDSATKFEKALLTIARGTEGDDTGDTFIKGLQQRFADLERFKIEGINKKSIKEFESSTNTLRNRAYEGIYASRNGLNGPNQLKNVIGMLENLETIYNKFAPIQDTASGEAKESLKDLLNNISRVKTGLLKAAQTELGLTRHSVTLDADGLIQYNATTIEAHTWEKSILDIPGYKAATKDGTNLYIRPDSETVKNGTVGYYYELTDKATGQSEIIQKASVVLAYKRGEILKEFTENSHLWKHPSGDIVIRSRNYITNPETGQREIDKDRPWKDLKVEESSQFPGTYTTKAKTKREFSEIESLHRRIDSHMLMLGRRELGTAEYKFNARDIVTSAHTFNNRYLFELRVWDENVEKGSAWATKKEFVTGYEAALRFANKHEEALLKEISFKLTLDITEFKEGLVAKGIDYKTYRSDILKADRAQRQLAISRYRKDYASSPEKIKEYHEDISYLVSDEENQEHLNLRMRGLNPTGKSERDEYKEAQRDAQRERVMANAKEVAAHYASKTKMTIPNTDDIEAVKDYKTAVSKEVIKEARSLKRRTIVNEENGVRIFKLNDTDNANIKRFYRSGVTMIQQGLSDEARGYMPTLIAEGQSFNAKLEALLKMDNFSREKGKTYEFDRVFNELRKEFAQKKAEYLTKERAASIGDKHIYQMAALNTDAMYNKALIKRFENHLNPSQAIKAMLQEREVLFSTVHTIINPLDIGASSGSSIFSGLGMSAGALSAQDFIGKMNGQLQAKGLKDDKGVMGISRQLRKIEKTYKDIAADPEIQKKEGFDAAALNANKEKAQKKLAVEQLDTYISMYKQQEESLNKISEIKNTAVGKTAVNGSRSNLEANQFSEAQNAAYVDQRKRLSAIQSELMAIKTSMANAKTTKDYDEHFNRVHDVIVAYDDSNSQLHEVFRSPTHGGTDPRLHTYRAMDGVQALNQQLRMMNRILKGEEEDPKGAHEALSTFDEERNITSLYMGAVGIVTGGGGDWDGDPYTIIFNRAQDAFSKVMATKTRKSALTLQYQALESNLDKSDPKDNKKIVEKKIEVDKASQDYNDSLNHYNSIYANAHLGIQSRARKQVANFLGIDERYLISAQGVEHIDENGKNHGKISGFGSKTYDADGMYALLNTGHGLFEGIDNAGPKMMMLNRNMDALLSHVNEDFSERKDGLTFLKGLRTGADIEPQVAGRGAENAVPNLATAIRRRAIAQLNNVNINLNAEQTQYLNYLANDADDTARMALGELMLGVSKDVEAKARTSSLTETISAQGDSMYEAYRATVSSSIGARMHNSMQGNKVYQKVMGFSTGDSVSNSIFELLTQSLSKAGGEILGKTYNTIVGATFNDAPIISLGRELSNEESDLYKATKASFAKQQIANASKGTRSISQISKEEVDIYMKGDLYTYESFDKYAKSVQGALKKSEGVQGFMKNIHQILRDSIKLKGGAEKQIEELTRLDVEYGKKSEEIAALDTSLPEQEYEAQKKVLLDARTSLIETMASKLGPGAGLKSLMNLDTLVNNSQGLSQEQFSKVTGIADFANSKRFASDVAALTQSNIFTPQESQSLGNLMAGKESDIHESSALQKVAQFHTAEGITSMVANYRFGNLITDVSSTGNLSLVYDFAASHRMRLAEELETKGANDDKTLTSIRNNRAIPRTIQDITARQDYLKGGGRAFENNVNRTANGQISQSELNVNKLLRERYFGNTTSIENTMYRRALAQSADIEVNSLYDEQGNLVNEGKLSEIAKESKLDLENYLLLFDMTYARSLEVSNDVFGSKGERLGEMAGMQNMRKHINAAMQGKSGEGDSSNEMIAAKEMIMNNLDGEALNVMAQLVSQNKLGTEGVDIFTKMFQGVMSTVLSSTSGGWETDYAEEAAKIDVVTGKEIKGADGKPVMQKTGKMIKKKYSELTESEKKRANTKSVLLAMVGSNPDASSQESSDSAAEVTNRNILTKLVQDDEWVDTYIKATEGTLNSIEQKQIADLTDEFILKATETEDGVTQLMDAFLPMSDKRYVGAAGKALREGEAGNIREFVNKQKTIRNIQHLTTQSHNRKAYLDNNNMLKRSSFMNQIDANTAEVLASNKGANLLDLIVPLGLTVVGQAIADGSYDGNDLQAIGGAAANSYLYARPSLVDASTAKDQQKLQTGARILTSPFKFRNALNRQDGDYAMAIMDTAVREGTGIAMNAVFTPLINNVIGKQIFGIMGDGHSPAMNAINMNKFKATQQMSANIGSSLISAVTSTILSGLIMSTVVAPLHESAGQILASFQPASDYVSSVNQQIMRRRSQEAAYEESFNGETDDGEEEISNMNAVVEVAYGDYNQDAVNDLQEMQDITPDSTGNLAFDFIQG